MWCSAKRQPLHLEFELCVPTVARSHGSNAGAESYSARFPADSSWSAHSTAAAADAAAPTAARGTSAADSMATGCAPTRSERETVSALAIEHEKIRKHRNGRSRRPCQERTEIWRTELLNAAEAGIVRNADEILKDDELVAANREKWHRGQQRDVQCVGEVHEL